MDAKLTEPQKAWIEANLHIARIQAACYRRRNPRADWDEVYASALFGLCEAPLEDGFEQDREAYAGMRARNRIYRDKRKSGIDHVGTKKIELWGSVPENSYEEPCQVEHQDEQRQFQAAIDRLPKRQWQVIKMRLAGKSIDQMKRLLGITKSAIMQRMKAARDNIQVALEA